MNFNIAQVNIGKMLAPLESPLMAEFTGNLDSINALAENSEGFVWRLKDDDNNATGIRIFDDGSLLVNMSVWKNIDVLFEYTFRTAHAEFLKRRREWFDKMQEMHTALWYVPEGHTPAVAEAEERLAYLRKNGETPFAFTFKKRFDPEEAYLFLK